MHDLHIGKLIGKGECSCGLYRMGLVAGQKRVMMTSSDVEI